MRAFWIFLVWIIVVMILLRWLEVHKSG